MQRLRMIPFSVIIIPVIFLSCHRNCVKIVINRSAVQEQGIRINHIPIRGGHLFWPEDISVLLDQYQDIREQQEELTARNRLLQKTYQKEAERRKTEEQNRLLNMIQNQTAGQLELLSQLMDELERTESREHYDRILGKIVVVGTYLKRRKNLVLTQYDIRRKSAYNGGSQTESCGIL